MNLNFLQNLRPLAKVTPIEKGSLLHDVMEVYYSIIGGCISSRSEVFKDLREAGLDFSGLATERQQVAQYAIEAGRYRAVSRDLDPDEVQETLFQCGEYFTYYKNDAYNPIAVEQVASKIIYEDEDVKFIYVGKMDLVVERGHKIMPVDHKSGSRNTEPSDMSNQFMGYSYLMGNSSIMVNRIGFQKTYAPNKRFQRFVFTYTHGRIQEWVQNTVDVMFRILDAIDNNHFARDYTSCDKYSGCQFKAICVSDPAVREMKIDRFYQVGPKWDPMSLLESGVSVEEVA